MAKVNYETVKKLALSKELISQKVKLSDVRVDSNANLIVNDQPIRATDTALQDLYKFLGIKSGFLNRFEKLTDKKSREEFIEIVKNAILVKSKNKSSVTMVANPDAGSVARILPGNKDFIPNEVAIRVFEKLMNNKDLSISQASYDYTNGLKFSVKSKGTFEKMVGEAFNPGFAFTNTMTGGMSLQSYVERLVCENGMTVKDMELIARVQNLSPVKLGDFFRTFISMKDKDFVSKTFNERLEKALVTKSSFKELGEAKNIILNHSNLPKSEIDIYLPEWGAEVHKLAKAGIDYVKCTDKQLANHATGFNIWEVINRVTDFASHDYGFAVNNIDMQESAGKMFLKPDFDMSQRLSIDL